MELYTLAARARGVDPDIGAAILADAGCRPVRVNLVQPVGGQPKGYEGDVKLTAPVTLESIADAILAQDVVEREELDSLVDDLYRLAADDETLIGTPRMVQAWGYRPVELACSGSSGAQMPTPSPTGWEEPGSSRARERGGSHVGVCAHRGGAAACPSVQECSPEIAL